MIGFLSCDSDSVNEQVVKELNGTYKGVFTVEYSKDPVFYEEYILSDEVTVLFENNVYSCSREDNYIPAGGSGKFEIDGYIISFEDENGWFADFDWNLILDGDYKIHKSNSTIVISAHKGIGYYKYELVKQ